MGEKYKDIAVIVFLEVQNIGINREHRHLQESYCQQKRLRFLLRKKRSKF